jgi:hypothetical protein
MRRPFLLLAPSLALVCTGSGCANPGLGRLAFAAAFAAAEIAQASDDAQAAQAARDEAYDGAPAGPVVISDQPGLPADEADHRVEHAPARFDLSAAYGAVDHVDVDACKADGLAAGYGRVVLGFVSDGAATGVALALPAGSSPDARACVEAAFRRVRVAPFDGAAVNVRRPFFVKA